MDQYIGEIRIFAGTYAPQNWAFCNGQLLNVGQFTPLFSVIGNTYGGDGQRTFALPNLQGQVPMGMGNGPGLTPRKIGETASNSSYRLADRNMPSHTHPLVGTLSIVSEVNPANCYLGSYINSRTSKTKYLEDGTANGKLDSSTLSTVGFTNPAPVSNIQPVLPLNFIICLTGGEFPHRPT